MIYANETFCSFMYRLGHILTKTKIIFNSHMPRYLKKGHTLELKIEKNK